MSLLRIQLLGNEQTLRITVGSGRVLNNPDSDLQSLDTSLTYHTSVKQRRRIQLKENRQRKRLSSASESLHGQSIFLPISENFRPV